MSKEQHIMRILKVFDDSIYHTDRPVCLVTLFLVYSINFSSSSLIHAMARYVNVTLSNKHIGVHPKCLYSLHMYILEYASAK